MISTRIRKFIPVAIPVLTVGIFVLDLFTPVGVVDWVLYFIPLLLSFYGNARFLPFILAGVFSVLTVAGDVLSPVGMDPGIAAFNMCLGIGTLWAAAVLISKLRRSSDEMRRLSHAVEQSPAIIHMTDLSGRITYVNPKFTEVTGYAFDEVAARNPRILKSGHTTAEDYAQFWKTIKAGNVWRGVFRNRKKDGSYFWASASIGPVFNEAGKPTHYISISEEITEKKRIEDALEESESRYRTLFENLIEGFAYCEMIYEDGKPVDYRYLDVNRAFYQITGLEDVEGKRATEVNPQLRESNPEIFEIYARVAAAGPPEKYTGYFERAKVWLSVAAYNSGQNRFAVAFENVTERKAAEGALHESEARLRIVTENARVGLAMVDRDQRYTFANAAYGEILGLQSETIIGRRISDLMGDIYESDVHPNIDHALRGERVAYESRRSRNGSDRFYAVRYDPMLVNGTVTCVIAVVMDITEQKRSHAEVAWKTALLEAQVNSALDAILVVSNDNKRILHNQRLFDLFQVPRQIAQNDDDFKLLQHVTSQMKDTRKFLERVEYLNARPDEIGRDEVELANGAILDRYSSPVRDKAGNYYGRIWTFRDITNERKLEAQLRHTQKLEGIGQLAAGVAHDFNNMLACIQLQNELLVLSGLNAEQSESTEEIASTVQRATSLTRQLLLFSRREVFQPRELDLSESISSMTKMLKRTLGETVQMDVKLAARPMFIHADAGMIDQVLLNLSVNARDAMPKGGRLVIETAPADFDELSATHSTQARPGSFVCLSVTDTGTGIAPDVLSRIFEPFFTTKDVGKGTGLGLATVFGIVQQHGGWINVYSEIGHGTTFRIYIPRLNKTVDSLPPLSPIKVAARGHETILLVEDDASLRASTRKILAQHGYRVLEAASGVKGLEVWKQKRREIDLLLTDLVMPEGMNGKDLAQLVLEDNPKLKIVYMSGYSVEVVGQDFILQEGDNFLTKPFQSIRLAQIIRANLDGQSKCPPAAVPSDYVVI